MVRQRGVEESVMGLLWRMNAALMGEVKQIKDFIFTLLLQLVDSAMLKRHSYHTLPLKNVVYLGAIQ